MTIEQQTRNMLIRAYRGAGEEYLAAKLWLLMATDIQIAADSHPAIRNDVAKEIQLILGEDRIQQFTREMARRIILSAQEAPEEGEQANG